MAHAGSAPRRRALFSRAGAGADGGDRRAAEPVDGAREAVEVVDASHRAVAEAMVVGAVDPGMGRRWRQGRGVSRRFSRRRLVSLRGLHRALGRGVPVLACGCLPSRVGMVWRIASHYSALWYGQLRCRPVRGLSGQSAVVLGSLSLERRFGLQIASRAVARHWPRAGSRRRWASRDRACSRSV